MYHNINPRRPSDDYQTPVKLTQAVCQRLTSVLPPPSVVVEPSAGVGNFVRAAKEFWPKANIIAVEVREECRQQLVDAGAGKVTIAPWETVVGFTDAPDLILGNPPYEFAQPHLELALNHVKPDGHVAFLLRMAFLNSQERVRTLWDAKKGFRYLLPLAQRPSFTGDGKSEHSEYAMYVFQKGYQGNAEILPHLWVEGSIRGKG